MERIPSYVRNIIARKTCKIKSCTLSELYSLCKSIRSEFLVNIFGYIHDITILTKNLCLGINYLHFLCFALNDPWVTYRGTQTIQTKIFCFRSFQAHNDIRFNVLYDIPTFQDQFQLIMGSPIGKQKNTQPEVLINMLFGIVIFTSR